MKDKFKFICIPTIVLSVLSFIFALLGGVFSGYYDYFAASIVAGVFMLLSIFFTSFAMVKTPMLSIGTIVVSTICRVLLSHYSSIFILFAAIFTTLVYVLSLVYVFYGICSLISKKYATMQNQSINTVLAQSQTTNSTAKCSGVSSQLSANLATLSTELQQFKKLLDCQIITQGEFEAEKSKLMSKYGLLSTSNSQSVIKTTSSPSSDIDGKYDTGTFVLTISQNTFSFNDKKTDAVAMSGVLMYYKESKTICMFKPDKSRIICLVNNDGNLVLKNGTVIPRMK